MQQIHSDENETALVIGGSMAGLLAARVLSDHFTRVIVVERDGPVEGPEARDGVPQGHQPHIFLIRGLDALDVLFPGISDELVEAGGRASNGDDWYAVTQAGVARPVQIARDPIGATRPLLEWCIRRRVAALPNVQFLSNAEAVGLTRAPAGDRVTGVRIRYRRGEEGPAWLSAGLVVDGSGRHSRAPVWLKDLGFGAPPEERMQVDVGYSSRLYRRPQRHSARWNNLFIMPRPPHQIRFGVLLAVEKDQWCVLLGGAAGERPPTDEAGYLDWARSLSDPRLYEAIRQAEPVSRPRGFGIPTTHWRHFERLARWPGGFIVVGDAVCTFNPMYGQGITVAALEALALGDVLRRSPAHGWERRFQRRVAKVVREPWAVGVQEDLRIGGRRLDGKGSGVLARASRRYQHLVLSAACGDDEVSRAYWHVVHMVAPPASLLRPRILFRVLRHRLRRPHHASAGPAAETTVGLQVHSTRPTTR